MLSHMIFYVADLKESLSFFKNVFNLETKFIDESGAYAELMTGTTILAFVSEAFAVMNFPNGFQKNSNEQPPCGCEIVFTSINIKELYQKALLFGAKDISAPTQKPWGQMVAYVRDPNGILIEIASPIEGN
jgi:catechol 2,3-dioxygenase-like lactoylglutathione lyase family enzyme